MEAIKQWFHEQWRASLDEVVRGRAKIGKAARWKLRDIWNWQVQRCWGPKGKKRWACYPHSLPWCFYSGSFGYAMRRFSRSTQTCIQFCFFLYLHSSFSLSPTLPPLSSLSLQNCRLYSKAGLFISFRTASPSLGSGLGGNTECRVTDAGPQGRAWLQELTSKTWFMCHKHDSQKWE